MRNRKAERKWSANGQGWATASIQEVDGVIGTDSFAMATDPEPEMVKVIIQCEGAGLGILNDRIGCSAGEFGRAVGLEADPAVCSHGDGHEDEGYETEDGGDDVLHAGHFGEAQRQEERGSMESLRMTRWG